MPDFFDNLYGIVAWQGDEKGSEFPHQGEKPYRRHPGESRGPVSFDLKSISW
jgi:hypothetical protein